MPNLSVSRLVKVNVILAALAAQAQNLSTLLLLTSSNIIDVVERIRSYTALTDVATDFGTTGPEYAAAVLYFQQTPQPAQLKIGRWAKTATYGHLKCAPLSTANQLIAAWNAITTGAFKISIDGVAAVTVSALNFSADANLNAVAARIQTAVRAANAAAGYTGATVVYNATLKRFEFTSGTTGATSSVAFLTAPGAGTDISAMLGGLSTSGGYVVPGQAAESALTAATLFDGNFGRQWYGLMIPEAVDDDQIAVAGFIEATNNKHLFGITTQDANALSAVATTDVAYRAKALAYTKTAVQYSSQNAYAAASLLAKAMSTNWNGNNTAITLMYKGEPGIVAESITETQAQALAGKNCNVFVNYDNSTAIIQNGTVASGDFIDTITGADAIAVDLQNELYNLLYTSPTKIPQTDAGSNLSVATCEKVCSKYVTNGFLAPGVWDQTGFGNLAQGDFLGKGFYVYAPPIASQLKADRQARKSVPIQIAAKCAGAVHSFDLQLNISR
jgi:hypothetical protein